MEVIHNFLRSSEFAEAPAARRRVRSVRRAPGGGEGRRHRDRGLRGRRRAAGRGRRRAGRAAPARAWRAASAAPVEFRGHVSGAGAGAACAARAAFAVAPSRWDEPCPYSVIEAMAAGLPVLAARSRRPARDGRATSGAGAAVGRGRWAAAFARLWVGPAAAAQNGPRRRWSGRARCSARTASTEPDGGLRARGRPPPPAARGGGRVSAVATRELLGVPVALIGLRARHGRDGRDDRRARARLRVRDRRPRADGARHDPSHARRAAAAPRSYVPDGKPLVWALRAARRAAARPRLRARADGPLLRRAASGGPPRVALRRRERSRRSTS